MANQIGDLMVMCSPQVRETMGWRPGRVKPDNKMFVFVVSPLVTQHLGVRINTGWLGIKIKCPNVATYLPTDCCFSELVLKKTPVC